MTVDLPMDNPVRMRLDPLIMLISHASRIRAFNKALGTSVTDLSVFPVDFVTAVIGWAGTMDNAG